MPPASQPADAPTAAAPVPVIVRVPNLPCFSPAAVASLLAVHRATVHNWIERGKLDTVRDNIGERYIMRVELVRFAREYLSRPVQE